MAPTDQGGVMYIESEFALLEANNEQLTRENKKLVAVCQILVNSTIDDEPGWKDGDPIFAEDVIFDAYEKAKQALAQVGE